MMRHPAPYLIVGILAIFGAPQADSQTSAHVIDASRFGSPTPPPLPSDKFVPNTDIEAVPAANGAASMLTVEATQACQPTTIDQSSVKSIIHREAVRQGVDSKLALAIADQESGYGVNVNSPAGARGIMQLMPATASQYGVTDICDAGQNIRGGIAFLKDLNASFGGNVMLMVAAYNSGEGRVLKSRGIPAIAETVNYTARVTNAYYGFDNALAKPATKTGDARHSATEPAFVVNETDTPNTTDILTPINRPGAEQNMPGSAAVLYVQ